MHQCKTVAQILILSIFNLVFGAPVVREMYDTRDDLAVPTAVGHAAVMLKEQHQSRSNGATASPSSPPPLYASSPSDGEGSLNGSPTPPGHPASLYPSSPSDEEASLHEGLTPPSGPAPLTVSSPPGEIVPATDQPVSVHLASTPQENTAVTHAHDMSAPHPRPPLTIVTTEEANRIFNTYLKTLTIGVAVIIISGGLVAYYRHCNLHHRTIDLDWYVSNPSHSPADD